MQSEPLLVKTDIYKLTLKKHALKTTQIIIINFVTQLIPTIYKRQQICLSEPHSNKDI